MLYVIPILTILSGFFIYRHNGKKEVFSLDLVQFFYTFLLAPLFFVWAKSFVYFLMRSELGLDLSPGQIFTIDTALTVSMLYVYAFIVMHSLTKSFRLKVEQDPFYDLFGHSEYIHLWLSHIVMAIGGMMLFFVIGFVNVFFPLEWRLNPHIFYLLCFGGVITGSVAFLGLLLTDPKQEGRRYMRLMKLAIGMFFLFQITIYFLADPDFNSAYGMFWFNFFAFTTMLVWSFFTYRSSRIKSWFDRITHANKDTDLWGMNTQLFSTPQNSETRMTEER